MDRKLIINWKLGLYRACREDIEILTSPQHAMIPELPRCNVPRLLQDLVVFAVAT